jgi:hypothetical protein
MHNRDFTEFYVGTSLLHRVRSHHRFMVGDYVQILKLTYKVTAAGFALDYSADLDRIEVVQTVRIEKVSK